MKTLQIYDGAAETRHAIEDYFGTASAQIQVFMVGSIADVSITYEDFKPIRVVRHDLETQFPNIDITEIHRYFSTDTQMKILQEMLDADELIYVDSTKDDTIRPIHIGELISERMYNRTV